ncbi:hypothetical protein LUZ60_005656 [Juncus effusus]|nr:hypothetical protein LUZ60_005656 [Juncus effusus]
MRERFVPLDVKCTYEMLRLRKDIVNFHGEMVLLLNYSSVNYTGLAKILKKYDKRTGQILRLPFIQKILQQPFFTTELISKLVKECEATMDNIFSHTESATEDLTEKEGLSMQKQEQSIFRNTITALVSMQEIRKGSSSFGQFSLPPLNFPEFEILVQSLSNFPEFDYLVQTMSNLMYFEEIYDTLEL